MKCGELLRGSVAERHFMGAPWKAQLTVTSEDWKCVP